MVRREEMKKKESFKKKYKETESLLFFLAVKSLSCLLAFFCRFWHSSVRSFCFFSRFSSQDFCVHVGWGSGCSGGYWVQEFAYAFEGR